MNYEALKKEFNIDTKKVDLFLDYLSKVNESMNLTSITKKDEMIEKHIYDSLLVSKDIDLNNKTILDVGSGGGFPGIPLAILFPNSKFVLLDSTNKKVNYLNDVIKYLKLDNVTAVCSRVESYNQREEFDVVISRAFSELSIYLELVTYLAKVNGYVIALKGPKGHEEYLKAHNSIRCLDLNEGRVCIHELPSDKAERLNIIFKKLKSTNKKYPREYSIIKKKPL